MRKEARSVVLFDFDGTLTTHDSFRMLVQRGFRRAPWRLLLAALGLPLMAVIIFLPARKRYTKSWLLWSMTAGMSPRLAFERLSAWGLAMGSQEGIWHPDVVARYQAHGQAGHLRVVCTASAPEWVRSMMEAGGLGFDAIIGSPLGYRLKGVVWVGPNCYGKEKTQRIERWMRQRSESLRFVAAYSDHPSDAPMLNLADTAWVIVRRPRDSLRFKKLLAVPWRQVGAPG